MRINKFTRLLKPLTITRYLPILLIVFGLIGLVASITISMEKTELIRNPNTRLVCDLNPVYSCAKIIDSNPSLTLGLPNEVLGMVMFSVLIAVGVVLLAGAKLKDWFWKLFILGMLFFMASAVRLFYISVYDINALCLLCSTVWFSGWTITVSVFSWVYDNKLIPKTKIISYIRKNIIGVWILLIVVAAFLILKHFWYYYGQYFGQ